MKKILFMLCCLCVLFRFNGVYASSVPGGKNYIDPNNLKAVEYDVVNIESIKVEPNTKYTFSLCSMYFSERDSHHFTLYYYDIDMNKISEETFQYHDFTETEDYTYDYLTFETTFNVYYIGFEIGMVLQGFHYDGLIYTMLEKGDTFTGYEAYISGLTDINGPEFNGVGKIRVAYGDVLEIDYIKSLLTAIDEVDGDISDSIEIITDNYSENYDVCGVYEIEFKATDNAGNYATCIIFVEVYDDVPPIFTGPDEIRLLYNNFLLDEDIISKYYVSDNVDGDISEVIEITKNKLTGNEDILGRYEVVLYVEDGAGNPATKTIYIVVYDDVIPVIEGQNLYTTGYTNKLNIEVIKDSLSAYDDCDGDISYDIFMYSDDYSENYNKVGEYDVVFRVIDASENICDHIVKIKVIDNIAPIIYIDATIVKVYGSTRITLNELVDMLYKNNELNQDEGYSVEVIADHYSKNYNVPGNYTYQIRLSNKNHTLEKRFIINVNESEFVEFKPSEETLKNDNKTIKIVVSIAGIFIILGSVIVYKRFH